MLDINAFKSCIQGQLKDKRFGDARVNGILDDFDKRAKAYMQGGKTESDAGIMAMSDLYERMSDDAEQKAKRVSKTLSVQASAGKRLQDSLKVRTSLFSFKGSIGSRGKAIASSVKAMIEFDPRFGGANYRSLNETLTKEAFALWGDDINKITVGKFGVQQGKAHLDNIIREVFGVKTGDKVAENLAKGWQDVEQYLVRNFNNAGGSMRELSHYVPQSKNISKLLDAGEDKFVADHMAQGVVDWNRTRWPDGTIIPPAEREGVLRKVYDTLSSDGINKIDATAFRGNGVSVGNALDQNRFLHYGNPEAWLQMHQTYGDGNVFDALSRHVHDMAHRTALIETFGPNPDMMMSNIQSQAKVLAKANGVSMKDIQQMDALFHNTVDPMMTMASHANPMSSESNLAHAVNSISNLSTSALLGSATIIKSVSDPVYLAAIRRINGMPMMGGMRFMMDRLLADSESVRIANDSGLIFDASVNHMYTVQRFNNMMNVGSGVTKKISDATLRASMMTVMDSAARFRAQFEMMAFMARNVDKDFASLPAAQMMARHGINAADWDAFRAIDQYNYKSASGELNLLRPIDIKEASSIPVGQRTDMFRKFQQMILNEARAMVPDSSIEASVALRGLDRPDTLRGSILHSFSMFKNFPLTYYNTYSRYAMTLPTARGRLGFIAGLTAGSTMAGGLALQLAEVKNGRDPMDMADPRFWVKALMKGGGAGIYGDFLFSSTDDYGGPSDIAAGPLVGAVGDAVGVVAKEAKDQYNAYMTGQSSDSKFPGRLVDFAHRYTPGSNIWYGSQVFNKMFWEHLENAADPQASQKRQAKMQKQRSTVGNEYYWEPGSSTPDRAPNLSNAFGGSN